VLAASAQRGALDLFAELTPLHVAELTLLAARWGGPTGLQDQFLPGYLQSAEGLARARTAIAWNILGIAPNDPDVQASVMDLIKIGEYDAIETEVPAEI
jgi:hypothetical protein